MIDAITELLRRCLFLPPEATNAAVAIDELHFFVILTTLVMSTLIGITTIYFMVRYRRRRRAQTTPHLEAPRWFEATIVIVPLALFLLWFRIGYAQFVEMSTPPPNAMDVYVTGKQWMWKFAYPKGPSGVNELRVPVNRPVRLLLTSRDVIHGFYVPAFRLKQDALPGRYTQTWFEATIPGTYPIFCTQYCGTSHSEMRASVIVMPEAEFDAWLASDKATIAEGASPSLPANDMASIGQRIAVREACFKCHSIDGTTGTGPTWRNLYGRQTTLVDHSTIRADEAYLTESMMDPLAKVVLGYAPVMPSYFGKLAAPDTAALVEYIKSLSDGRPQP